MGITQVIRPKLTVETITTEIRCNVCGNSRTAAEHDYGMSFDMHTFKMTGGYGDDFPADQYRLQFVACGDCLKAWTLTFVERPVYEGPFSSVLSATHSETGEVWKVHGGSAHPLSVEYDYTVEASEETESQPCPHDGTLWEHFKGNRYLVLRSVFNQVNPSEMLVVYQALYGASQVFIRPATMWYEVVAYDDGYVHRFRQVDGSGEGVRPVSGA